jgi:hypothetical protein
MGRKVSFQIDGENVHSEIIKVDRTKLYGSTRKVVFNKDGQECELSDLYEGSIILPKGSISQVLIDDQGNSVSRSDLIGFNSNGEKVNKIPSIFSIDNKCKKVTIETFLSYSIVSIYQLVIDQDEMKSWRKHFMNDEIYSFEFNYREDYEGDDAFLLSNDDGIFIGVGKLNDFEFLDLSNISLEDSDEGIDIEDDLDFSMF